MTSDRMRRQLERLLDEAETAVSEGGWGVVAEKARAALAIEAGNADAVTFLRMAEANLGVPTSGSAPASEAPVPRTPSIEQPTSFAAGRYAVRRFLGEGGKKRVFLAHDERLDRDVAFALIKTEGLDDVGRERTVREAQAMGRLGAHPHVVTIFEIGEESGAPYVVTELLGGGDVEGLLANEGGALPLARTLEIAKGVARGLAFAHQQGVVHRDLKPGNVWLTSSGPDGVAKIGDFGLAVALDRSRLTTHGLMVGTVAYMPPEQALGGEVTPQADLYSLGAMLYELVTGKPPFAGDSPTAIISQHINTPPVAPSWHSEHCPPELEALILKLLAKVPAERPASALEVLAALETVDPEAPSVRHSDSSANPLDRLARGVFVGRERELERLRSAFDEAFAGRGSVVMLVGEPGIGKTRTSLELETYARMRGAKTFWGRTSESSGAPPFWPWVQIGRAYRDHTPEDTRRRQWQPYAVDLQRLFPGLRDLFPGLPEPPPVEDESAQFRLFDAFSSFLRSVSEQQPLVIALDDLHWADRPTLALLTHLARELTRARILVVGTYRDTDLDRMHPLSRALAELNREQLFTRINLRGLTRDEVGEYIRATAQVEPTARLIDRVHEETEGNAFFLSEVVNLMAQEGSFEKRSVSDVAIPEGVKEALGRRLDRLSPEANVLLATLSVAGREFEHALIRTLSGHDDETTLRLVEEALRARVLEESGAPGGYRFTHALMQETLLGELSAARRVLLHGQIAQALEALYGMEDRDHLAAIAEHYRESALLNPAHAEQAIRTTVLAAAQPEAANAWEDAAALLQSALLLAGQHGAPVDVDVARLHWRLARAARQILDYPTAVTSFHAALDALTARGDPVSAAELVAELANPFLLNARFLPREVNTRALEAMSTSQRSSRVDLEAQLRLNLLGQAPGPDAAPELDALARLTADHGLGGVHGRVLFLQARLAMDDGRPEVAERIGREAAVELEAAGSFAAASQAWELVAQAVAERQGLEEALAALRSGALAGRRSGSENRIDADAAGEAALHVLYADTESAFAALPQPTKQWTHSRIVRARLAEQPGAVEDALTVAMEVDAGRVPPAALLLLAAVRARLLSRTGNPAGALSALEEWERLLGEARALGFPPYVAARSVAELDEALADLANDALIREAYGILSGTAHGWRRLAWWRPLDYTRGRLALRLGLPLEEAEGHFRTGLEWCERERCPVEAGRCLQGLADVAEARGDHADAMQHLDAAGAKFAENGAKLYLDQVLAKKQVLKA